MKLIKLFAFGIFAIFITGCGVTKGLQGAGDRLDAKSALGKQHSEIVKEKSLGFGLSAPLRYGLVLAEEQLASGNVVKKHGRRDKSSSSSFGGLLGKSNYRYRIFYFLVDAKGVIQDYATGTYDDEASDWCFGEEVAICSDSQSEIDQISKLDKLVKTSSDEAYTVWK